MPLIQYNDKVTLEYEHIPIKASSNVIVGTKYFTKVYLVQDTGRYFIGEVDERLDEDRVKEIFGQKIGEGHERQYGSQRPMLRRELKPIRDRNPAQANTRQAAIGFFR